MVRLLAAGVAALSLGMMIGAAFLALKGRPPPAPAATVPRAIAGPSEPPSPPSTSTETVPEPRTAAAMPRAPAPAPAPAQAPDQAPDQAPAHRFWARLGVTLG